MQKFTNPLDSIRVASPCPADWNKMYGDERKKFCADCKLNVYNLSDMTKQEAESFLINSEDRTCVKFYRRKDGTVITRDCPVGWQKLKKKVSQISTAVFASVFGLFCGIFVFQQTQLEPLNLSDEVTIEFDEEHLRSNIPIPGQIDNLEEIKNQIEDAEETKFEVVGRVENIRRLEDEPVILWIK